MRDDATLVQSVLHGDQRAFTDLIDRHKNKVYGVCMSVVGDFDLAEDMAQEAFIEAYQRLRMLNDATRFSHWLLVIALNKSRMHLRRRKPFDTDGDALEQMAEPISEALLPADQQQAIKAAQTRHEDLKQATLTALNRLSVPDRQALTMFYLGDASIKEVAQVLGISPQAAKMRLHRARIHLQKETLIMVTDTLKKQGLSSDFKNRFQVSDITILFSDITGFAGITNKYPPEVWVNALYEYMTEMTDILLQYEGVLDSYEGDSIRGLFGAPNTYDDHAVKACLAALDMQARLDVLNAEWDREGKPVMKTRIGLHSGTTMVGNFGSRQSENFSAIGDNAHIASRMEALNGIFGTHILISGATYKAAQNAVEAYEIAAIRIPVSPDPIRIYEVVARKGEMDDTETEMVSLFKEGYTLLKEGQTTQATDCFARNPDHGPSKMWQKKAKRIGPEGFNGVLNLKYTVDFSLEPE